MRGIIMMGSFELARLIDSIKVDAVQLNVSCTASEWVAYQSEIVGLLTHLRGRLDEYAATFGRIPTCCVGRHTSEGTFDWSLPQWFFDDVYKRLGTIGDIKPHIVWGYPESAPRALCARGRSILKLYKEKL